MVYEVTQSLMNAILKNPMIMVAMIAAVAALAALGALHWIAAYKREENDGNEEDSSKRKN